MLRLKLNYVIKRGSWSGSRIWSRWRNKYDVVWFWSKQCVCWWPGTPMPAVHRHSGDRGRCIYGHTHGGIWAGCYLLSTHYRDKMAAILLITFSNSFSGTQIVVFRFRFHWNLFPMVQLVRSHHFTPAQRRWMGCILESNCPPASLSVCRHRPLALCRVQFFSDRGPTW